jgi:hypothetical protein
MTPASRATVVIGFPLAGSDLFRHQIDRSAVPGEESPCL